MKRTIAQRMAPSIRINADLPWSAEVLQSIIDTQDTGAYRAPCWLWTGRMTRVKPTVHIRTRFNAIGPRTEAIMHRPVPEIEIAGKRQHPARVLFEAVTAVTVDPRCQVRSTCHTHLCVNPAHRQSAMVESRQDTHPEPVAPRAPDEIDELADLLRDHARRYRTIEELREGLAPEFTLAEYGEAFDRNPELRNELIRR